MVSLLWASKQNLYGVSILIGCGVGAGIVGVALEMAAYFTRKFCNVFGNESAANGGNKKFDDLNKRIDLINEKLIENGKELEANRAVLKILFER